MRRSAGFVNKHHRGAGGRTTSMGRPNLTAERPGKHTYGRYPMERKQSGAARLLRRFARRSP